MNFTEQWLYGSMTIWQHKILLAERKFTKCPLVPPHMHPFPLTTLGQRQTDRHSLSVKTDRKGETVSQTSRKADRDWQSVRLTDEQSSSQSAGRSDKQEGSQLVGQTDKQEGSQLVGLTNRKAVSWSVRQTNRKAVSWSVRQTNRKAGAKAESIICHSPEFSILLKSEPHLLTVILVNLVPLWRTGSGTHRGQPTILSYHSCQVLLLLYQRYPPTHAHTQQHTVLHACIHTLCAMHAYPHTHPHTYPHTHTTQMCHPPTCTATPTPPPIHMHYQHPHYSDVPPTHMHCNPHPSARAHALPTPTLLTHTLICATPTLPPPPHTHTLYQTHIHISVAVSYTHLTLPTRRWV